MQHLAIPAWPGPGGRGGANRRPGSSQVARFIVETQVNAVQPGAGQAPRTAVQQRPEVIIASSLFDHWAACVDAVMSDGPFDVTVAIDCAASWRGGDAIFWSGGTTIGRSCR